MIFLFDKKCPYKEEDLRCAVQRTIDLEDPEVFKRFFLRYYTGSLPSTLFEQGKAKIMNDILRRERYDLLEWLEKHPDICNNLTIPGEKEGSYVAFNDTENPQIATIVCQVSIMS